jgi:outer membrane protein assembly factor BamB
VAGLVVRWRFPIPIRARDSGVVAATPVVGRDTVYVQDLESDVFALDRRTGAIRWQRRFHAGNPGPNGLALSGGTVFGATDTTIFALSARDGRTRWARRILSEVESYVDVAPVIARGLVFTSTVGYPPGGRGALYALDAATGHVRWRWWTVPRWRYREAGGGGAWYPPSIDRDGRLFAGIANPAPWGGSPHRPNGGAYPGPALYTDSLVVLAADRGRLLWYDQVTSHDVRDYDFQLSPILAAGRAFGAGKAGRVIAWDIRTRRRLWEVEVGLHRNDRGPLPRQSVTVCPGLLGGVETPMAYDGSRLFVPVVDLCHQENSIGGAARSFLAVDPAAGSGRLVALDGPTGRREWERRFKSPVFGCATVTRDVVFTASYDGWVYALASSDGRTLWRARARAGINACPSVAGDLLLVPAGVAHPAFAKPRFEVIAYGLSR